MTVGAADFWEAPHETKTKPARSFRSRRFLALLRQIRRRYSFTSIARRIVVLNMLALVVLVGGILYLNQFRAGLIENRRDSLLEHGKIISLALAEKANAEADRGQSSDFEIQMPAVSAGDSVDNLAFALNVETVTPIIRQVDKATGIRARVYDRDGVLLADSKRLYSRGEVLRFDLPPVAQETPSALSRLWLWVKTFAANRNLPTYRDIGAQNGKAYKAVEVALDGGLMSVVSLTEKGETIMIVGVPVQRLHKTIGALMLTSAEGEIDKIIANERAAILYTAALVLAVTVVLSIWLAGTIAGPMRRLAAAADRVRITMRGQDQIPVFEDRADEIGNLSFALRDMTKALFQRKEATECFAADVAHELKNPLTSLKSAAEMLSLAKTAEDRERLVGIIQHDVSRMNRLITDISDASRLDGELARETFEPIDAAKLVGEICSTLSDIHREGTPSIEFQVHGAGNTAPEGFVINGHGSRIGQVINNIIDNAISFSPENGKIYVTAKRARRVKEIEIAIEDDGPGIAPENLEKVFTRFYTDRPGHEPFGRNSGLGLHISQQIVNAHGGRMWAENRISPKPRRPGSKAPDVEKSYGARFVIRLPAA
jgi:two-component system sensor histidine kinase ChvG